MVMDIVSELRSAATELQTCAYECDDDCTQECHAVHEVSAKRDHTLAQCAERRALADLIDGILATHSPWEGHAGECDTCAEMMPCPTLRLLATFVRTVS